jgi:uncharacterized protein YbaA (DUF1428 family)
MDSSPPSRPPKKVMEDPRIKNAEMPFDGKRMIYGGFQTILDS